eukprot:SM000250S08712  [mRNA]  locus=s250:141009:141810:+ [translate_table: standard]
MPPWSSSGSTKSLAAGLTFGVGLLFVFAMLPADPTAASGAGLALAALLLATMGSRYAKSQKFMPAGLVSLASLVMAGGYIHGLLRTTHA